MGLIPAAGSAFAIDAVLFDFDHTLGVDNKLEQGVLHDFATRYCRSMPTAGDIEKALGKYRAGDVALEAMLTGFFGARDGLLEAYKQEALRRIASSVQPMPGALETVRALRSSGLNVAILTNGWTELQRAKAAAIGFDGPVIVSEEIGAWKPDRRAFAAAADVLGVALDRSMYVGDNPKTDVGGAKAAGMIAVWADLEGQTYPSDAPKPDYTITALLQLREIVRLV